MRAIIFILCILYCSGAIAQGAGINTASPSASAQLDIVSSNKGILIPRVDYNARPSTGVASGTLIYVTANGPSGNNSFYYYNGTTWLKYKEQTELQSLSLGGTALSISSGNTVQLGDTLPVQGDIKCSGVYINPYTDNNNCGACGTVCSGALTCKNGTCQ